MAVATYPAYAASSGWYIGAHATNATGGTADGATGTTAGWFVRGMRLRLNAGTYTLQYIHAGIYYAATAKCDAVRFGILSGNSTTASLLTLSNGLTYVDVTVDKENTDSSRNFAGDLGDVTVTLPADATYWFVLMLHKVEGSDATYPGIRQMNDGQWVLGDLWKGQVNGAIAAMPTDTTGLSYVAADNAAGEQSRICLEISTANRILYTIDSAAYAGAATEMIVPRAKTIDYFVLARTAVVAAGEALTIVGERDNNADEAALATLVLDMGATDQVTFGGANVALNAVTPEAGDDIDLAINVRDTPNKIDLFYKNTSVGQGPLGAADFITISHACKNGAARDEAYACSYALNSLKISGTATVAKLQIGWEPLLLVGDSQGVRLAAQLPTAFTYDRLLWSDAISGGLVTGDTGTQTSIAQRFLNDTPGAGDMGEMTGGLFVVAGCGINDISASVGTSETARNGVAANIVSKIAAMASQAATKQNPVLIIGLPPYSDENASTQEAKAVQHQLNPALEGVALAVRGAYVNPWYACLSSSPEAEIPVMNPTYTVDTGYGLGLHYSTTGASVVAAAAARSLETGIVGGWWSKGRRREARGKGSLWPI